MPDVVKEQPPEAACKTGESRDCYTGPTRTKEQGECKSGTQSCQQGQWGKCVGETIPRPEVCDGKDNDCDGNIDEEVKGCVVTFAGICGQPGKTTQPTALLKARFGAPNGIAFDPSGDMYLSDQGTLPNKDKSYYVYKISPLANQVVHYSGHGDKLSASPSGGSKNQVKFDYPSGLWFIKNPPFTGAPKDALFMADTFADLIWLIAADGSARIFARKVDASGTQKKELNDVHDLAYDPAGKVMYISDYHGKRVVKVTDVSGSPKAEPYFAIPQPTNGDEPIRPTFLAITPGGALYFASKERKQVFRIGPPPQKQFALVAGLYNHRGNLSFKDGKALDEAVFEGISSLLWDAQNKSLLIADSKAHRIRELTTAADPKNTLVRTLAGKGAQGFANGPASAILMGDLGFMRFGPKGHLYFADSGNSCVRLMYR